MNRVKTLLAASVALALAFTVSSCSDDKDDEKEDNKYCVFYLAGTPYYCVEFNKDFPESACKDTEYEGVTITEKATSEKPKDIECVDPSAL